MTRHVLTAAVFDRATRAVPDMSPQVFNKGTGFPVSERDRLGIRGLVPPKVLDIEQQAQKARVQQMAAPG